MQADETPSLPGGETRRTFLKTGAIITAGIASLSLSARAQVNDPTVPCNPTNNSEGDSESCYIGPRSPEAVAQRRKAEDGYGARGQANTRRTERPSKVRRSGE